MGSAARCRPRTVGPAPFPNGRCGAGASVTAHRGEPPRERATPLRHPDACHSTNSDHDDGRAERAVRNLGWAHYIGGLD